jgi:hypothetical protein
MAKGFVLGLLAAIALLAAIILLLYFSGPMTFR